MATATTKVPSAEVKWGNDMIIRPLAATAQIYYPGAMIALDSSGNATKCLDTAALKFDGLNREAVRVQVFSGDAAGDHSLPVGRPWRFVMAIAAAVAGDEGKPLYAVDDQTVGYTSSNAIQVGWVDQVLTATSVLVRPMWAGVNGTSNFDNNTLSFTGANTLNNVTIPDNLADALHVQQGSNKYALFVTTDGSESSQLRGPDATATTNAGGAALLTGGIGGSVSGAGGAATVAGGAGTTNALGGVASVTGGAGNGTGAGAAAQLVGGVGGATGAGGAVTITGGAGGATSGTSGAVNITGGTALGIGGAIVTAGGAGSNIAAGGTGLAGGAVSLTSGAGGTTATGTGGAAGAVTLASGVGGNATGAGTGGAGGALAITGGVGGSTTTTTGGAGSTITVTAGAGGAASGSGTGGAGGNVNLVPGLGGTTSGGAAGANGSVLANAKGWVSTWSDCNRATPTNTNTTIFFATRACKITGVSLLFNATAGGTSTLDVTHETTTGGPGSGTTVLNAAFNLNATGNTVQNGALTTNSQVIMAAGDRLSSKYNHAIQATTGVSFCVEYAPQ